MGEILVHTNFHLAVPQKDKRTGIQLKILTIIDGTPPTNYVFI